MTTQVGNGATPTVVNVELSTAIGAAQSAAVRATEAAAEVSMNLGQMSTYVEATTIASATAVSAAVTATSAKDTAVSAATAVTTQAENAAASASSAQTSATTSTTNAAVATAKADIATAKADIATAKAGEAAASAAAAATFDPSSYYPKADFKAQGTADAPAKYDSSGNLLANSLYLDKPLGNFKGVIWRTSGVLRMAMQLNATDVFQLTAYDDSGVIIGDILTADRATRTVTFGVIPKIAGIVKGDLLVGIAANALGVLSGGSTGQILTKQANGSLAWSAAPSEGVSLDVGVGNIGSFYYGCSTQVVTLPGSTVAGSTLRGPQGAYLNSSNFSVGAPENPSLSGTWRSLQATSMGAFGDNASSPTKPGLFQRII